MSHGRVFYRCGCLRMQCRCPGPHVDTVLPMDCGRHCETPLIYRWYEPMRSLEFESDRERLIDDARD